MEALVSKAYGKKDYDSCVIYLNQSRYMLLFFVVPQFLIFLFLENIFDIFGQPEQISHSAWIFCVLSFPGIISMSLFELNRRYLVCWGVNYSGTIITIFALVLHIILLFVFVIFLDYGVYGSGISTTVSFGLTFGLFEIECWFQKKEVHNSKWRMPRGELIIRAKEFLNYTIPSWLSMVSTWIPIEILNVFAGVLGSAQLNASVMFSNIFAIMYVFTMAFSYAISTSIGNSLGENRPNKAKRYFTAAITIWITLSLIFVVWNLLGKEALISLYTSSDEEATQARQVFELYIVDIVIGIFQVTTYSTLIVLGYQFKLLVSVLIIFWLIMLPLCSILCLAFYFGFFGLRLIRTLSFLLILLINIYLSWRINWEEAALEASKERE